MREYFRILSQYIREYRLLSFYTLVMLFVQAIIILSFQIAYKEIFDGVAEKKSFDFILIWIGIVVIAAILRILAGVHSDYISGKLALKIFGKIRLCLFNKLQWFPAEFYQRVHMGDLVSHYSHDLQQAEMVTRQMLPLVVRGVILSILSWLVLFYFNWKLTLFSLALFPFVILGAFLFLKKATAATQLNSIANAKLSSIMEEMATQHLLLQAFNLQDSFLGRFKKLLKKHEEEFLGGIFLRTLVGRTSVFGLSIVEIIIFSTGAVMAYHGMMTIGTLFGFFAIIWNISGAVSVMSGVMPNLIEAGVHMRRLQELLSEETDEPTDEKGGVSLSPFSDSILFKDVTVSYSNQDALRGVSLLIKAGERIGLVGPTGSGKSTMLSLLMGFFSPSEGELLIDGNKIRQLDRKQLRAQIGVVFQQNPLFNTSLKENIRIGKLEASDEEIIEAAKSAEIHDFIESLPDGYDTLVKEYGTNFSGGQKQRIALARAYLRNPAILLLDEPTSALDPIVAAQVEEKILELSEGKTVIMCTHRLSSLKDVDRIFVLVKGQLIESGSHTSLMQQKGIYHTMWEKQHRAVVQPPKQPLISPESLRNIPLFQSFSDTALQEAADNFVMEWREEGVVIPENEYIDKLYLIVRGSVELQEVGMDPLQDPLKVLAEGDYFGETEFFETIEHETQVVTRSHCMFLTLHMNSLL